ncbi:unnamed protein product [Lathyrus sativus]|nr:unnamed protein product [Lathyrus sativus]
MSNFTFLDDLTETSWGFNPTLGQVSFTRNVLETTTIADMDLKTTYSRRIMTFQIPSSLIISSFLSGVIDRFGLLTSPSALHGPSYAPTVGRESFFRDLSMPPLDLDMSLGLPSTFTRDVFPIDELPHIGQARVQSFESVVGEAEDDDTEDSSEHDYEGGYDEDGSYHTLSSACRGLCGAGVGGYYGCH